MGACNIELTLDRKASRNEIYDAFKNQQDQDRNENGHRDGYSGDFQTVHKVDYRLDQVFTSYNEAHEYCLKHASKWDTVVAVYYCDGQVKSKALDRLNTQLTALRTKLQDLQAVPLSRAKNFQTCECCKSKVSLKHFQGSSCPVCRTDLRPDRLLRSIATLKGKIDTLTAKRDAKLKDERQKLIAKASHIKTMIAGWGAC
jgi:hypothetical protein